MKNPFKSMDNGRKLLLVVAIFILVYVVSSLLINLLFPVPSRPPQFGAQIPRGQSGRMMDFMNYYSTSQGNGNYALLLAAIAGIVALYYSLQTGGTKGKGFQSEPYAKGAMMAKSKKRIILSRDEKQSLSA